MTTRGPETLTHLVKSKLTEGGGDDTLDTLTPRCVDPESGYRPSRNTVWKLSREDLALKVKINPTVVKAIAAGVGVDERRAQAAAAFQFTGYEVAPVEGGVIVHAPGADPSNMPKARAIFDRWDEEESDFEGNHSA